MDTQKYNGWTNYATWLVNLHFDCLNFTDEVESGVFDDMNSDEVRCHVAMLIQGIVESYLDEVAGTDNLFVLDVVSATINDVDWHDIADHYLDDIFDEINARDLVAA